MKCVKCGNELRENDMFCPECGTPVKKVNTEARNQNEYTYDRPVNQQINYGGQPNNYRQANYNPQGNYGQQYAPSKNTNDIVKICVIAVIVFIILGSLLFIGRAVMKVADKTVNDGGITNDYTSDTNSNSTSSGLGTITSISSGTTSTQKSNTYKISYAGFKLYIPDNLVYEMDYINNAINIGDAESTWVAQLGIKQGAFSQLKQNKSYLSSYLMQEFAGAGATVSNATVETIGGVEYVLLECKMAGTNMIIGYAGLNSMYSAYFEIMNENNDFDRNPIKNLSTIISSAEYSGDSTYMKSNENINLEGVDKAFDKVLKEKK